MGRIFILAKPSELFEFIGYVLTKEGHHVRLLHDFDLLVSKLTALVPDLVIIDAASLSSTVNDLKLLVRHRRAHRVRTLILEDADGKATINADAYLRRPLNPSSLVHRVELLVTKQSVSNSAGDRPLGQITVADLVIDLNSFQVTRSGRRLSLSLSEFRLLHYLASNPNTVFRRNHLLKVALENRATKPRTVDSLVRHLRQQIEEDPRKPRLIQSVRTQGYTFRTSSEPSPTIPGNSASARPNQPM